MERNKAYKNTFWMKALKVSVLFQLTILLLVIVKSFLGNEVFNWTISGFGEAALISIVGGAVVGILIALKDRE